ncbi:MAG TPA: EF-P beta-lysylation protein EpmB [Xylella sp.]
MITAASPPLQPPTAATLQPPPRWQQLWRESVRDPRELLALLELDPASAGVSEAAASQFPLRVPRGFVSRMRPGDLNDPLLRQVLPIDAEQRQIAGFGLDAVGDNAARRATGIIQKYQGRILLIATGSCAVHCRYCFRRHFPYAEDTASHDRWQETATLLSADPSIEEVVLSGGDPLSLSTAKLTELTDALRVIPHLRRLRIHSRLPVVLPERIDTALLNWLKALPWPVAFVIHANHPNEFDASVDAALAALRSVGTQLLNQAVLLHGVNDNIDTLAALSERSFAAGVLPYYLHQLDRIAGTAHYEVEDIRARALHAELTARLSGYLVPRLVRELPGERSKRPL